MRRKRTLFVTQAAMIAALYVVLTMIANAFGLANYAIQAADSFRPVKLERIQTRKLILQCEANHTLDHMVPAAETVIDLLKF